jgi:hypothetical protein
MVLIDAIIYCDSTRCFPKFNLLVVHGEEVPEAEERQAAGSASSPPDYKILQMPSCPSAQAARINLNRVTVVSVERITIITPHSYFYLY